jgi:hypothetical protein
MVAAKLKAALETSDHVASMSLRAEFEDLTIQQNRPLWPRHNACCIATMTAANWSEPSPRWGGCSLTA